MSLSDNEGPPGTPSGRRLRAPGGGAEKAAYQQRPGCFPVPKTQACGWKHPGGITPWTPGGVWVSPCLGQGWPCLKPSSWGSLKVSSPLRSLLAPRGAAWVHMAVLPSRGHPLPQASPAPRHPRYSVVPPPPVSSPRGTSLSYAS